MDPYERAKFADALVVRKFNKGEFILVEVFDIF
jgi:hypothetical protein